MRSILFAVSLQGWTAACCVHDSAAISARLSVIDWMARFNLPYVAFVANSRAIRDTILCDATGGYVQKDQSKTRRVEAGCAGSGVYVVVSERQTRAREDGFDTAYLYQHRSWHAPYLLLQKHRYKASATKLGVA